MIIKSYSELIKIPKFIDRFRYLKLNGSIGEQTFYGHRWLNQVLYQSPEWRRIRNEIIIRDDGCDLACPDRPINGKIYIHHINPLSIEDIVKRRSCVFDLENLISASFNTHNAIHYGEDDLLILDPVQRLPNDTCPWKNIHN